MGFPHHEKCQARESFVIQSLQLSHDIEKYRCLASKVTRFFSIRPLREWRQPRQRPVKQRPSLAAPSHHQNEKMDSLETIVRCHHIRAYPVGPARHFDAFCPGTIFVSQLPRNYPHRRGNFERGKMPSPVGERQFGRNFRRQFGRG